MAGSGNSGLGDAVLGGALARRATGRQLPFAPTGLDMELLEAADAALAARVPLAVVLAPGAQSAPVLLGAAAVVGAVLHRGKLNVQVAVASPRLSDRVLYDELAFRTERLAEFVPRGALTTDGDPFLIGRPKRDAGGRLWLTGRVERLAGLLPVVEGVVLAAGTVDTTGLTGLLDRARGKVPVVYLTADPHDPNLDVVRSAGGVLWGWDVGCLPILAEPAARPRTADAGALLVDPDRLRGTATAPVEVRLPAWGSDLDDALDALWRATGTLASALTTAGGAAAAGPGLRWAWGTFHAYALLPVAPSVYDRHAGANPYRLRFAPLAETARAFARNVPAGEARDGWHRLADAVADAVRVAEQQPRTPLIIDWVCEQTAAGRPGVVLTRSLPAVAALSEALHESPRTPPGWENTVAVHTIAELARGAVDPDAVLGVPGTLPRNRSAVFALPPPAGLTVLACGPGEGRRVVRQASAARARMAAVRRETVEVSGPALGVMPRCGLVDYDPAAAVRVADGGLLRPLSPDERAGADEPVWDPFTVDVATVLLDVVRSSGAEDDTLPVRTDGPAGEPVPAIAVHVDSTAGPQVLLIPANDIVTRRRAAEIRRVAAKALQPGDRLLLVDRAARTDLRVALTERLAERTQYAALRGLVEFWHERAAIAGRDRSLTQQAILDRMTGTRITTAGTIGNWIRGVVDGPGDKQDLSRFARAVGDQALLAEAERVAWALRTLHSVNQKLGHWLAGQVAGASGRAGGTVVDAELGVHVADLLDAVAEYEVTDMDLVERPVPGHLLGLLQSEPASQVAGR